MFKLEPFTEVLQPSCPNGALRPPARLMPTELSKFVARSNWNRQPTSVEPTCNGGEPMPKTERGQPHLLCLNFVFMSSLAHEPKGFEPDIAWREFTLMQELFTPVQAPM